TIDGSTVKPFAANRMTVTIEDAIALEALETKLKAILPPLYRDLDGVRTVSMGSAPLKYGLDGKVAWDEMWATFCDLAMAGGPPHRGNLLQPAPVEEITAASEKYREVVDEIRRGISLVTALATLESDMPGWVGIQCRSRGMAAWLVRAIVMENVL